MGEPYAATHYQVNKHTHQAQHLPGPGGGANNGGVVMDPRRKKSMGEEEKEREKSDPEDAITKVFQSDHPPNCRTDHAARQTDTEMGVVGVAEKPVPKLDGERGQKNQCGESERVGHLE